MFSAGFRGKMFSSLRSRRFPQKTGARTQYPKLFISDNHLRETWFPSTAITVIQFNMGSSTIIKSRYDVLLIRLPPWTIPFL